MDGAKKAMQQHFEASKYHLGLAQLNTKMLGEIADLVVAREY